MTPISALQEYVTLIKDGVSIISTLILAVIAWLGLRAWKIQLKGKTEYELARRLLRTVYKVREAISYVRSFSSDTSEMMVAIKDAGINLDPHDPVYHHQSQIALYQLRWKTIQEAISEFDTEAFEAEVVWGFEIRELLQPLREQIRILLFNINQYLRNLSKIKSTRVTDPQIIEDIENIIFDKPDINRIENKNQYSENILEIIAKIEDYLRPKVKL